MPVRIELHENGNAVVFRSSDANHSFNWTIYSEDIDKLIASLTEWREVIRDNEEESENDRPTDGRLAADRYSSPGRAAH